MKLSQQILLLNFLLFRFINSKPANCRAVDKCGNVTIPYPFSTVSDCYLDESYYIECDPVTHIPRLNISSFIVFPQGYGTQSSLEVLEITLDGRLIVALPAGHRCYNGYGNLTSFSMIIVNTSRFPFSSTQNKFVGVGCDIEAKIMLQEPKTNTSCPTNCDHYNDIERSCQGFGCCVASIPQGTTSATILAIDNINHSKVSDYSKCGHAFMVEHTKYNFSVGDLTTMRNDISFPVVLEWVAGDTYCDKAIKDNTTYMCKGKSVCYEADRESGLPGYRCKCSDGYSGNPCWDNLDMGPS